MTLIELVRKNLFRKPLRTILTVFAIFIAFAIFGVLATFQNAMNAGIDTAGADRLIVTNKINFTLQMPIAYVQRTRGVEGVKIVTHADWFGGYYQDPRIFFAAIAVEPASYLDIYPEYLLPPAQRQAFISDRTALLAGETVAKQFGWKVGDRIPLKSNIFQQKNGSDAWDFTLVGIIKGETARVDTNFVIFQYEYFKETRSFGGDTIGWMIVKTQSPKDNANVMKAVDVMFANSPFETETQTEQAFAKAFLEQAGDLGFIISAVVGAAFATILLIVGNTMMLTVRERTNEIAVMKTIGFTSQRIFGLVIGESLLLTVIGGALGLLVAWLLSFALQNATGGAFGPMTFTPGIAIWSVVLMAMLGLLTGLIPALRAMRINVVTALGRK
ncbi:MAG: FtsX-like permease family protein [Alphaproteobacteria bacterium]|nr:FtsX-like permease family protein [Alphaproteobacteria bacterium]